MGFLRDLLGTTRTEGPVQAADGDELAVRRYEYLLRTAPPETVEQIHTEAFERLTLEQRDLLFQRLTEGARTPEERPADALPATLARTATRAEVLEPGALARLIGGHRVQGTGEPQGGPLLHSIAAYAVASTVFEAVFLAAALGQLPLGQPQDGRADEPAEDPASPSADAGWGDLGL